MASLSIPRGTAAGSGPHQTFRAGKHYVVPLVKTGANRNQVSRRQLAAGDYDTLMVSRWDATVYLIPTIAIRARYQLPLSDRWSAYRVED